MHNGQCRSDEKLTCSNVIAGLRVAHADEDSVIAQRWEHERLYTVHSIKYFCHGIAMVKKKKIKTAAM